MSPSRLKQAESKALMSKYAAEMEAVNCRILILYSGTFSAYCQNILYHILYMYNIFNLVFFKLCTVQEMVYNNI